MSRPFLKIEIVSGKPWLYCGMVNRRNFVTYYRPITDQKIDVAEAMRIAGFDTLIEECSCVDVHGEGCEIAAARRRGQEILVL